MNSFKVLGINYGGHDTSACLMIDGNPVACCEEERYNKIKHTREFPINAINDCLKKANLNVNDLDEVAFTYNPDILKQLGSKSNMRRSLPNKTDYKAILKEKLGYEVKIKFHPHHMCHIASAYYPSGFENALLISNDGIGEIDCSLMASGKEGAIKVLDPGNRWPNSLGLVYSAVTVYLGWKPHYDEGIVMGLAPYGDDSKIVPGTNRTYKEIFEEVVFEVSDYQYEVNPYWVAFHRVRDKWVSDKFEEVFGPRKKWEDPITENHKNIACALQRRLEDIMLKQLRRAQSQFGLNKLCIAGGVGLNCSLNGKIEKEGIFEEIFVQPASGDSGTPLGACYLSTRAKNKNFRPSKWHNFYLGSSHSDEEVERFLISKKVKYEKLNGYYAKVVEQLENGKIVGWFQDGAEFGPRALGNRSILTSPFPGSMKDHINARVKFREEFRPFAPAVLDDKAKEYFNLSQESPHMLIATKVKHENKEKIAAVVHVDNSARVQTVSKTNNLKFRNLLNSFYEKTGCPVLLNTSFNVKGQPIVNDPKDAYECFKSTNIDVLVMGDFFILKKDASE